MRGAACSTHEADAARLTKAGSPKKIVEQLVRLAELDGAIGIAALASKTGVDVVAITRAFTTLGEVLALDWAQGTAMQLDPRDPWERLLAAGLARDFQAMRLDFLARKGGKKPEESVAKWIANHHGKTVAFKAMVARARASAVPTTAMLAQIAGQARTLLSRSG